MSTNTVRYLATALAAATALLTARATDYYVSMTGDDNAENAGTQQAPFATIDKAVITATSSEDVIYVAPGEYETGLPKYVAQTDNAKWGPNLKAKLVGTGTDRANVILKSHGDYRTLRMAANSWVENVTIIGEGNYKADKGGAIEMSGGVLTNCVVRAGTATQNGGNIWIDTGIIVDCEISNGTATGNEWNHGGGNVFMNGSAAIVRCEISEGTSTKEGAGIRCRGSSGVIESCLVHHNNGGGICLDHGSAYNCTSVDNSDFGFHGYTGAYAKIHNCVSFGNGKVWSGTKSTTADSIVQFAANDITGFSSGTALAITSSVFVDYANGNYKPVAGLALCDAGVADPRGDSASASDLSGKARVYNEIVDIGCYEYHPTEFSVDIVETSRDRNAFPALITFTLSNEDAPEGEDVSYIVQFGDGGSETVSSGNTVSHTYAEAGQYALTVVGLAGEESAAKTTSADFVKVWSSILCVNSAATPAFPYNTSNTGYLTIQAALAVADDGSTIEIYPGVYETQGQIDVSKAIHIAGKGNSPEDVIVRNKGNPNSASDFYRVFQINNAGAFLENIVMENGNLINGEGANLRVVGGLVSNCVIRSGLVTCDGEKGAGGGVEIAANGTVTHCVITNNVVIGTGNNKGYTGGAVFFEWKQHGGRLSNSLVAYNTYKPAEATEENWVQGSAGVRMGGANDGAVIEGNTIVSNVVDGLTQYASAGFYSDSWSYTLRNNVIAGNYDTYRGQFTAATNSGSSVNVRNNATDDGNPLSPSSVIGSVDDFFKDFANGDFRPRTGGKLYNKGATPSISTSVDLLGNPRVFGRTIDIGCYESQVRPGVIMIFY